MTFNTGGAYEVELRGCVSAAEDQILAEDFLTKFIAFVEENGWSYGGGIRQIIDGHYVDGNLNPIKPIEEE